MKLIKTITNEYFLCITIDKEIKPKKSNQSVASIDPNFRNVGTLYSDNEVIEFGDKIYESIIPMIIERDKLKREYKKDMVKKITGEKENTYEITRQKYRKKEQKIKNKMDDLHYKVITKLIEAEYSLILIPKLNVTQILQKETTELMTKKIAKIESPMKFLNRLQQTAEVNGITVKIVDECMTTQSCGNCYSTYKFKGDTYECTNCGLKIGRDPNSARNIYIKEICKLIEMIKYLKEKKNLRCATMRFHFTVHSKVF